MIFAAAYGKNANTSRYEAIRQSRGGACLSGFKLDERHCPLPAGARSMSIRTIIKTSNLAQLLLLLLLGLCLVSLGRGLNEGRRVLENYYRLDSLLVDVETNTRQSYEEAHAFIFTGNPERYAKWQMLNQDRVHEMQDAAGHEGTF